MLAMANRNLPIPLQYDAAARVGVGLPGALLKVGGDIVVVALGVRIGVGVPTDQAETEAVVLAEAQPELVIAIAAVIFVVRYGQRPVLRIGDHQGAEAHVLLVAKRSRHFVRGEQIVKRIRHRDVRRRFVGIGDPRIYLVDVAAPRRVGVVQIVGELCHHSERQLALQRYVEAVRVLARPVLIDPGEIVAEAGVGAKRFPGRGASGYDDAGKGLSRLIWGIPNRGAGAVF
ncbi:MAG: hypothetical protein WDO73_34470 [Ignavibacteriota bacterium]